MNGTKRQKSRYEFINNCCRVCLRKTIKCRSIFIPFEDGDLAPNEMLKLVTGVVVENSNHREENLPINICKTCEISLNMAYNFRARAVKSDRMIDIYCNQNNKNNIVVALDNGRKFTLSKELTLKVVKLNRADEDSKAKFTLSKDISLKVVKPNIGEIKEEPKETLNMSEIFLPNRASEEKDPLDHLKIKRLDGSPCDLQSYDHEDADSSNEESGFNDGDINDNSVDAAKCSKLVQTVLPEPSHSRLASQKPAAYNMEEIKKRIESSDKYKLIDWKESETRDSAPVIKLLVKKPNSANNSREYICEVCGNIYNKRQKLTEHKQRYHAGKEHVCEICGKRFSVAEGLRRHVLTHGDEKPYKCRICHRRFNNMSSRRQHEIVHSGAKPHICKTCGKGFSYSCTLRKHILIHEEVKLYRCDFCNKDFRLLHHLKQHEETTIHQLAVKNFEDLTDST